MANIALCKIFRVPYYWVWITVNGNVIRKICMKQSDAIMNKLYVKILKASFILPKHITNPIRDGSGILLVYDSNNVQPLDAMSEEALREEYNKDKNFIARRLNKKMKRPEIKGQVSPTYFVPQEMNPKLMESFLSAHVAQDILSEPKPKYQDWIILIMALAMASAIIIAALYFTAGSDHIIVNATVNTVGNAAMTVKPTPIYYQ